MKERHAFTAELKRARERRGLSLDAIAEQTKVSATLYAGLERGDLSRWPSGIFRRAFVRSYAGAVGLDPEETLARFTRVFRDSGEEARAAKTIPFPRAVPSDADEAVRLAPSGDAPGSRLALDSTRFAAQRARRTAAFRRVVVGLVDVAMPLLAAGIVASVAGAGWFWPVAGCAAVMIHVPVYVFVGSTLGVRLVASVRRASAPRRAALTEVAVERQAVRQLTERSSPQLHRARH